MNPTTKNLIRSIGVSTVLALPVSFLAATAFGGFKPIVDRPSVAQISRVPRMTHRELLTDTRRESFAVESSDSAGLNYTLKYRRDSDLANEVGATSILLFACVAVLWASREERRRLGSAIPENKIRSAQA